MHNLSRLISVINPRELEFKKKHPHVVADRFELLTTKNNIKDKDRIDVSVFGYLRGGDLSKEKELYLSGLGYVKISEINAVSDPCPPYLYEENKPEKGKEKKKKKRTLKKREKVLYAPLSNIGLNMFDESGDYINIPDQHVVFT